MARLGVMMLGGVMGGIVMSLGHCVITWLGPGAGGASGHPAIRIQLQRLHRCMVWCGRVWYFVKQYGLYYWWAEKSKIFNYSLYYCIFNCVNCRHLPTQSEADLPLEAHLQNPWIASLLKPLQNPALSDLPFIEPTHVGRMIADDIKGAILPW